VDRARRGVPQLLEEIGVEADVPRLGRHGLEARLLRLVLERQGVAVLPAPGLVGRAAPLHRQQGRGVGLDRLGLRVHRGHRVGSTGPLEGRGPASCRQVNRGRWTHRATFPARVPRRSGTSARPRFRPPNPPLLATFFNLGRLVSVVRRLDVVVLVLCGLAMLAGPLMALQELAKEREQEARDAVAGPGAAPPDFDLGYRVAWREALLVLTLALDVAGSVVMVRVGRQPRVRAVSGRLLWLLVLGLA